MARLLLLLFAVIFAAHCFLFVATARPIRGLTGAVVSSELFGTGEGLGEAPSSMSSIPEKGGEGAKAEAPEKEVAQDGTHRSSQKSMAGGEVIIGGLVMVTFAAVFCYIRITRKKETQDEGKS